MDKIKSKLVAYLIAKGLSEEDAAAQVNALMVEDGEPTLDTDVWLRQDQEYARPLIEPDMTETAMKKLKVQYKAEFIGKLLPLLGGDAKRTDFENLSIEQIAKKYDDIVRAKGGNTNDAELQRMVDAANEKISLVETEWKTKYDTLESSHNREKQDAANSQGILKVLGGKKLTVDQSVAAKAIKRDLEEKYHMVWNETKGDFDYFDKANPTIQAKNTAGTGFIKSSDEVVQPIIKQYNWEAVSNGGAPIKREPVLGGNGRPVKQSKTMQLMQQHGHLDT